MKQKITITLLLLWAVSAYSQATSSTKDERVHFFVAYELGEMAFNKFQTFAGEAGMKFKNRHTLRLVHMNVKLTENHLSSSFAAAVDGENVKGLFYGNELFYDIPAFQKLQGSFFQNLYVGPSVGYYKNEYEHTILDESIENKSATVGLGISYRETNIFGVKGLYYTFSIPMRFSLNPMEKTQLGDTTIKGGSFENNIWFFIGFQF